MINIWTTHPTLNFLWIASFPDWKRKMPPSSLVYEFCIDESSLKNKEQDNNQVKPFRTTLQHILDSYHVSTMFQIFLASTLVSI
jgi:hypothetical protein